MIEHIFMIKPARNHGAHIYDKLVAGPMSKFCIRVPVDQIPPEIHTTFNDVRPPSSRDDGLFISANSMNRRPEVVVPGDRIDHLVKALARLDARNVSRDRIFEGQTCFVHTEFYWEARPKGNFKPFYACVLVRIHMPEF